MIYDEVNAPLGFPIPAPLPRRSVPRLAWLPLAASAAVALGFSASSLDRREPAPRVEIALAAKARPEPAPAPAAPPPAHPSSEAKPAPALPPIASAEQVNAASGVKITRNGANLPPGGVLINVQQAIASQRGS